MFWPRVWITTIVNYIENALYIGITYVRYSIDIDVSFGRSMRLIGCTSINHFSAVNDFILMMSMMRIKLWVSAIIHIFILRKSDSRIFRKNYCVRTSWTFRFFDCCSICLWLITGTVKYFTMWCTLVVTIT